MKMNALIAMIKAGNKSLDNMDELLELELNELWSSEQQVLEFLPDLCKGVNSPELRGMLEEYHHKAKLQRDRLQTVFHTLRKEPRRETSAGTKGLVDDATVLLKAKGHPDVKDAALLAAMQTIHHYEMACYGSARTFARELGQTQIADMLQQTLNEEGQADHELTSFAIRNINVAAAAR